MTVIKPNSIAGIVSVTAQGDVINFFKSDGTLAGLEIGGARISFGSTANVRIGDSNTGDSLTSGTNNNFLGASAGRNNTTGCHNNFFGQQAGFCNTTGFDNNFFGRCAGCSNTTGRDNNFFGGAAGRCNTTGCFNNFFGQDAGFANTTGNNNNFFGDCAGRCNTTGCYNNFFGKCAGFANTTGSFNNFFGKCAGFANTTGNNNNFLGAYAGRDNTTGSFNNFFGRAAGLCNTTGCNNNFIGRSAGRINTTGCYNNFFGHYAGFANTTGSCNTFLGRYAGCSNTSGSHNIAIGNDAQLPSATGSCQLVIGSAGVNWIYGDSSGNVGIGTTNPGATLNVVPTSTTIAGLFSGTTSSDMVRITQLGSGNALVVEDSANPDVSPFVIDSSGSVGIGTTNPLESLQVGAGTSTFVVTSTGGVGIGTTIPGTKLHVLENNTGTTPTVRIQNSTTTAATNAILLELFYSGDADVSGAATSAHYIRFRDSNTNPTGAISGATGTTVFYNTTSDYRLKEDVTPFTNGIEKIMQLKPCEFTWKGAQIRSEGFIAHEVQEIIPGAVFGAKDAVNEDGNIEPQMIDPSKMVVHLTAALQEAVKRIEYLEAHVGIVTNT